MNNQRLLLLPKCRQHALLAPDLSLFRRLLLPCEIPSLNLSLIASHRRIACHWSRQEKEAADGVKRARFEDFRLRRLSDVTVLSMTMCVGGVSGKREKEKARWMSAKLI
ncbi:hypothetical protein HPP92_024858 [Vanilla planifolia]|uniref:Uncharacterized protein n=1 Tax=Vanilla planifolia TaxID=51239 RepID=A0A835PLM7_VANPL|nr:hypothetical protein HPP92_025121 [Vanilla planifolia]KAG0453554.1 hypothetical protein HPP92_024858 [Vanilla planifolia]